MKKILRESREDLDLIHIEQEQNHYKEISLLKEGNFYTRGEILKMSLVYFLPDAKTYKVRILNAFPEMKTVRDLLALSEAEFLKRKWSGPKTLDFFKKTIEPYGINMCRLESF